LAKELEDLKKRFKVEEKAIKLRINAWQAKLSVGLFSLI
jgi:regulator of sigma D